MTVDQPLKKKKTLLEKYGIPISNIDFPYVKTCSNKTELEQIIKVLRSNEEGSYPELLSCAEEKLRSISPDNKLLRTIEPVLSKSQLDSVQLKALNSDLMTWKNEVEETGNALIKSGSSYESSVKIYPDVRAPKNKSKISLENEKQEKKVTKKVATTDYEQWSNFDVDSECLKIDLEEEKKQEERERKKAEETLKKEREAAMSLEEKEMEEIAQSAQALSTEERTVLAKKEKDIGNEFYKSNRFNEALKHYSRSIYMDPTPVAYNNRAATYLRQCKFSKALEDLNKVLEKEPDNVKGRYRRALAFQHKNEFRKALEDIEEVLQHEPNHILARYVADQLRENIASLPKKRRVKVRDINNPSQLITTEVTEEELLRDYKDRDYLEVNDWGLPKIMCNCNGKHTNDPAMKSNDPLRFQHIRAKYGDRSAEKIAEMQGKKLVEPVALQSEGSMRRLEIVEVEKVQDEYSIQEIKNKEDVTSTCIVSDRRKEVNSKDDKERLNAEQEQRVDKNHHNTPKDITTISNHDNSVVIVEDIKPMEEQKIDFKEDLEEKGEAKGVAVVKPFVNEKEIDQNITVDNSESLRFSSSKYHSIDFHRHTKKLKSKYTLPNVKDEFAIDVDSDDEYPMNMQIGQIEETLDKDIDIISRNLFPSENMVKCECGEGYKITSSQFHSKWFELERSPSMIEGLSKLIRLICPHQLSSVIGSSLEEPLLVGLITCLSQEFDSQSESHKIEKYLEAIAQLQRFSIIYCFLSSKQQEMAKELIKQLNSVKHSIQTAFT